ncbi:MAG: sensor histidine kinase [Leptospiraceae bacterium]|nr:sensor histidine kinase [Leptospiraceae bacterium]MCP5512100.1 sensor histidine kinase [Leptospiraceae bacterium]
MKDSKYSINQPILIFSKIGDFSGRIQKDISSFNLPKSLLPKVSHMSDYLSQKKSFIFIFHDHFPETSPAEFIQQTKQPDRMPPITVLVSNSSYEEGLKNIRKWGFDRFLPENYSEEEFSFLLKDILELQYLRGLEENLLAHEGFRVRYNQKLNPEDVIDHLGRFTLNRLFIYNLATSLSQGSGVGTTVSLVDMIKNIQEEKDGKCIVDKEVMDLLFENNEYSRSLLDGLQNTVRLMDMEPNRANCHSSNLMKDIPFLINSLNPYMEKKNIKINFPKSIPSVDLKIDEEKILMILEELLLNAYKYGSQDSTIDFLIEILKDKFIINIKNKYDNDAYQGVPKEMEKILIEPFFRNHPPVDEIIKTNKFGLGLGLTAVDYIIHKHNGSFTIKNIVGDSNDNYVLAEIQLPIFNN